MQVKEVFCGKSLHCFQVYINQGRVDSDFLVAFKFTKNIYDIFGA